MSITSDKQIVLKYTLSGFIIGLATILLVILLDIVLLNLTLEQIGEMHSRHPAYIILDLSPVVLALYAYLLGRKYADTSRNLQESLEREHNKIYKLYNFVEQLRKGNTDAEYKIQDDEDLLGRAVMSLRDELKKNQEEEEKRRKEDQQRHWTSEGLAKFGEILRQETDDLEEISYQVISNLVKYIGAVQGSLFIIEGEEDNDKHLEMKACYAYDRRKFPDKRVEMGEGLMGATLMEEETTYITELPQEYVNITSGLGHSTPDALLIVPLIVNEQIHGAIELASFHGMEQYVIDFVEKVGESVASTISNVKINAKTSRLLEESQKQAEELASKEEEMRQNMEELKATQEEAARQSERFVIFSNAVSHTMIHAEYDPQGYLLYANTKFINKLGYESNKEVEGKHISEFIDEKDRSWFDELWDSLAHGGRHFEDYMKHVTKQGKDLWTMSTYTCMRKDDGSVEKILYLGLDTTSQKKQSLDYEGQIQALNQASQKVELLPSGDVLEANENFNNLMEYSESELTSSTIFDFVPQADLNDLKETWEKVAQGEIYEDQMRHQTKSGKEVWLQVTLSPVLDIYGDISKVIYVGHDITKSRKMEIETARQAEMLREQEKKLKQAQSDLTKKLEEAREEVKQRFKDMEKEKLRNERTLEGASDAILTIDQEGTVKFFNKAAEELWQIEKPMILGKNLNKLFPNGSNQDDFIERLLNPNKDKVVGERKEVNITNTSGEEVPVIMVLSMAHVEDETTYTAFVQNISVDLF
ncbi:MAG: PAS domain S-box protein [Bacteroidales bacterium]